MCGVNILKYTFDSFYLLIALSVATVLCASITFIYRSLRSTAAAVEYTSNVIGGHMYIR